MIEYEASVKMKRPSGSETMFPPAGFKLATSDPRVQAGSKF